MKEVSQNMRKGVQENVQLNYTGLLDYDNKTGLERHYRASANKYEQPDNKHESLEGKNVAIHL